MLPTFWKTLACCSGALSQATRSWAAATCLPELGTARNEPPQLPAAGAWATFHLPALAGPEYFSMFACCQDGQMVVAKVDCENAVCQGVSNSLRPCELPAASAFIARSQAVLTLAESL